MSAFNINSSSILVVNDINTTVQELVKTLPLHSSRVIKNEQSDKDEFLIAQSNAAIKEAYIASNSPKFIILCGATFRKEAQNSLLKVLEEPPKNIVFIIVTTSKSSLLPTIISRVPLKYLKVKSHKEASSIDIAKLDLKETYAFLKQNQKISKIDAKELVESLMYKVNQQKIKLSKKELESFSTSIKLLDLNSRPISVLTTLLLTLVHTKHKSRQ
ncbi:MAG: DNA polymerase III subunit delta' [Candidatus Marinarcus sp.]|uniref:DNA polymerase III subunit delta' n=1 Tax=Candidatus Marinarcus sp. TaxID=3100987 RepID=UPI003AFF744C